MTPHENDDLLSGLAGERTRLAWNRTALALGAAGGALLKGLPSIDRPRDSLTGALIIAMAGVVWFIGSLRYRSQRDAERRHVLDVHGLRILAFGVSAVAVAALVVAFIPSRG